MNYRNTNVTNKNITQPWLSIIIPIYNAENFLQQCLDSILGQTYKDFEVILIDDGSTDTSSTICQEYSSKDKRVHYIKKENGGAYQSRVYGAEKASGTYITFCDADDFYLNKKVFTCLHREITESNCQAMQFGYVKKYNHLKRKCIEVKSVINTDKKQFNTNEYPKLLCSFWETSKLTTSVCNKIYHRSLLTNLPSSKTIEKVFWGDDLIMNLHLLSNCDSFRFVPDILYCYRQFSGGTNQFSMHTMKDLDNIKKYQLQFLEYYHGDLKNTIEKILFSEIAGWFFSYIQQALKHLNEEELILLINDVLQYPRFILAREYYLNKSKENWDAVNLLRKSDALEYIQKTREYSNNKSIKDSIKKILKKIYAFV